VWAVIASVVLGACGYGRAPVATVAATHLTGPRTLSTEELVRVRCALDGSEVLTGWSGEVFGFVADERPRHLFSVVGMNVARCLRIDGRWHLTSRELMLYLDPKTGARIDRWTNPWTGATVPVVHVANRLVQNELGGPIPATAFDGVMTLTFDIPLSYPNPLARDPRTAVYSPAPGYVAGEFFSFEADSAAVIDPARATVPALRFSWHRVGPWLPWMAMGNRPGVLVYRAHGRKHDAAEMPAPLRAELETRTPLFSHAPRCIVAAKNETSWTYFARHVGAYEAGATFPVEAPEDLGECSPATVPVDSGDSTGRSPQSR
jgi:hypothetical protein